MYNKLMNYKGSNSMFLQPSFTNMIKAKPSILSRVSFKDINNLISGAQKVIDVYDRAVPIINQTKPMIDNIRTTLKVAKVFKKMNNNSLEKAFDNLPDYEEETSIMEDKIEEKVDKKGNNPYIPML